MSSEEYDVVVVGAGNAALSAAISAYENGARVVVLEKAPRSLRGGDTRFSGGGFRFVHKGKGEILEFLPDLSEEERNAIEIGEYSSDRFYSDLMRVTHGLADPEQAEIVVKESNKTVRWLTEHGVKWELWTTTASKVGDKLIFQPGAVIRAQGAGEGLAEMEAEIVEKLGIEVLYETKAMKLLTDNTSRVVGVKIRDKTGLRDIYAGAVVLGCGGFQANPEMRVKYLGPGWDLVKVRGTRYNTGDGLVMALEIGAQPTGHWSGCHCSPVDANMPPVEIGDRGNRYSYPYSIMVNELGERFVDEGEDFQLFTYAKFGSIILKQPHGIAFQIFDQKTKDLISTHYANATPIIANTIEELAKEIGIDPKRLKKTVEEFNAAVLENVEFNPGIKDGKCTVGIEPPKSNWALKLDTPPHIAYAITGGITFTFGGLKINKNAQVLDKEGNVIQGLYACGEITGGLFYYNYPGGAGLTKGAVFGRIAGANAAKEAS